MPYTHLRKGRYSQTGMVYHVTTVTLHRTPHFSELGKGRKVVQELKTLQEQGKAETLCYVLMPDHLHWLMVLQDSNLPDVMHLLKGRSARAIGQSLWQDITTMPCVRKKIYARWHATWWPTHCAPTW